MNEERIKTFVYWLSEGNSADTIKAAHSAWMPDDEPWSKEHTADLKIAEQSQQTVRDTDGNEVDVAEVKGPTEATPDVAEYSDEDLKRLIRYGGNIKDIIDAPIPEPPWIIKEVMPVGLGMKAGRPKVGKSVLGLQIARSIATGEPLFDRFEVVQPGRVLVILLEDSVQVAKQYLLKQEWPRKTDAYVALTLSDPEIGNFDLAVPDGRKKFIEWAVGRNKFILIDPFTKAFKLGAKVQDDMGVVYGMLAEFHDAAHQAECAIWFTDHFKKMRSDAGDDSADAIESTMGSTAKVAAPDVIWGMGRTKTEGVARINVEGRGGVSSQSFALSRDASRYMWKYEGDAEDFLQGLRYNDFKEALKDGPMRNADIARTCELDESSSYSRLERAIRDGYVVKADKLYYWV